MADRMILPTPGVAVGQAMGWIVLTWNGRQWQDDWDGDVHTDEAAAAASFHACRKAGWDAILVRCIAEFPPAEASAATEGGEG